MLHTACNIVLGFLLMQLFLETVNADTKGWIEHNPDSGFLYDLENFPIQVKTKIKLGSGDALDLYFENYELDEEAGDIYIYFSSPPTYELYGCTSDIRTKFETELPAEKDGVRIWTFTLSREDGKRRVVIQCNNEEVLNVVLSNATCTDKTWRDYWKWEVTKLNIEGDTGVYRRAPPPCSAGNYMTVAGCQQCGEDTYSGDGAHSCESCPDGKSSAAGSSSEADCKEAHVEDKKHDYSGALVNSLSGIITACLLTLLIC